MKTETNTVPVYTIEDIVLLSKEREQLIQSIKSEVATEYDNIAAPVPFIVTAS